MIDQDKIREILAQAGLDVVPTAEDFDKQFNDIGLDSLDVFNFLSDIEVLLDHTPVDPLIQLVNRMIGIQLLL